LSKKIKDVDWNKVDIAMDEKRKMIFIFEKPDKKLGGIICQI